MDTKKLRQKILDLAIHGKLVPQDPNDEPASVLLEHIKVEKERLIKEGKIKKSKKSAKTSDTPHYPYLLPKGWEWCKLEDIVCELKYGTSEKSSSVGKITVLRMGNITDIGTIDYSNLVYSSNDEDIKQYSLKKGDLLFNRTNSSEWVGKTAIYKGEQPAIYAGYLIRVRPILISSDYLNIVMNSSYYRNWCYNVKTDAVNQSNINAQKLSKLMVPIPPLKEQERIVVEMAKWTSLITSIKNDKEDLQAAIKQTKSKILDLAIYGKLVPQDPNDEPAAELLKRINPKTEITCDNGHSRKLPKGWIWTILGSVGIWQAGGTPSRSNKSYFGGNIPWLKTGDLNDGYISEIPESITEEAVANSSAKINPIGSVLIAMYGATIGKLGILTFPASTNQACCACIKYFAITQSYLFYFLLSHRAAFIAKGGGGAQPNISKEIIVNTVIPLPPLAEQQRIVAKIEELFSVLDNIQNALEA